MATAEQVAALLQEIQNLTQKVDILQAEHNTPSEEVVGLRAKVAAMEGAMTRSKAFTDYRLHTQEVDLKLQGTLPEKFNMSEVPIFKGTDNPHNHLRAFSTALSLRGIDKSLYVAIFPQTLDSAVQTWFFSLDPQKIRDWASLTSLFIERYADNVTTLATLRDLEITKQNENEVFTAFVKRWR